MSRFPSVWRLPFRASTWCPLPVGCSPGRRVPRPALALQTGASGTQVSLPHFTMTLSALPPKRCPLGSRPLVQALSPHRSQWWFSCVWVRLGSGDGGRAWGPEMMTLYCSPIDATKSSFRGEDPAPRLVCRIAGRSGRQERLGHTTRGPGSRAGPAETCSHVGMGSVTAHLVHSELCGAEPEPAKGQARAETEERESGARVGDPGQQQLPGRRRAAEGAACGDLEVLSLELALQPRTDTVRPKEEPSKVGAGPVEAHSFDVRAKC